MFSLGDCTLTLAVVPPADTECHRTPSIDDASGNPIRSIDPLGLVTRSVYDQLDHVISSTDPAGQITQFTYDVYGNRSSLTDPRNIKTVFSYDSLDRMTGEGIVTPRKPSNGDCTF